MTPATSTRWKLTDMVHHHSRADERGVLRAREGRMWLTSGLGAGTGGDGDAAARIIGCRRGRVNVRPGTSQSDLTHETAPQRQFADHSLAARGDTAGRVVPSPDTKRTRSATVLCDHYWDWDAAERHFRRAIELDPGYAPGHQLYAEYLRDMRLFEAAMRRSGGHRSSTRSRRSTSSLRGPFSCRDGPTRRSGCTSSCWRHPTTPFTSIAGLVYVHSGQADAALAAIDAYDPRCEVPDAIGLRGRILARLDRTVTARAMLDRLEALSATRYVSPCHAALIHYGLGELEQSLDLIEQSVAERSWFVRVLNVGSMFDPLRAHPCFRQILETVGIRRRSDPPE
jgi:hypothetical protein